MKIRTVRSHDIPVVTEIYADAVQLGTSSWEWTAPDVEEMKRRHDTLVQANYPYLVCEIDERVVGYSYAAPFRERAAYSWAVENSVYVSNSCQGKGVGSVLLLALIEQCMQKDYRQMLAIIGDSGNLASIRLHEKAGFRNIGTIPSLGWKKDQWLDWVLMSRELGAGSLKPPQEVLS